VNEFQQFSSNECHALQLVSGFAEMFGTELVKNHQYTFKSGTKVAVFSWQGCVINISFGYALHMHTVLIYGRQ